MKFSEFDLNPKILKALEDMGYEDATEIQEKTLQAFGEGKHILGQSQTGSGKTAAFLLPLINSIDTNIREPQVLILAPTRELAAQIREEVYQLSKGMYMRSLAAFGGLSKRKQIEELRKGPQIVVGTPGRIEDLIDSRHLRLNAVKYFVLDEVDRMLDMGFIDTIRWVWNRLDTIDQALTFSATLPDEVTGLLEDFIGTDYVKIQTGTKIRVDTVDDMFMFVGDSGKYGVLKDMLKNNDGIKTIIFTETKRMVDILAYDLNADGFVADSLHGDVDQRERFSVLRRIQRDEVSILVATDVAARGLNMKDVQLVVNYEVPNDPESYVHRIGRTARAGKSGFAIMLIDRNEWGKLHAVERTNKIKIKQVGLDGEEQKRTDQPVRGGGGRGRYNRYSRGGGGGGRSGSQRSDYVRGGSDRSSDRGSDRNGDSRPSSRGEGRGFERPSTGYQDRSRSDGFAGRRGPERAAGGRPSADRPSFNRSSTSERPSRSSRPSSSSISRPSSRPTSRPSSGRPARRPSAGSKW